MKRRNVQIHRHCEPRASGAWQSAKRREVAEGDRGDLCAEIASSACGLLAMTAGGSPRRPAKGGTPRDDEGLDRLLIGNDLSISESERLFQDFFSTARMNDAFRKTILVLIQKKGVHSDELCGLIRLVRKHEPVRGQRPPLRDLVDGCGTGGDGACTINISTLACLVASGAGAFVAKHGNRSVSSRCGSADLLESLGVKIDAPYLLMMKALRTCRFSYWHAPLYHPRFKMIQPLRRELARRKVRTIFNIAGPLLNPLRTCFQVIGVFRKDLVPVVAEAAQTLGLRRALVFWNDDGTDELTTTAPSFAVELKNGLLKQMVLDPAQLGFRRGNRRELKGGSVSTNRTFALAILSGKDHSRTRRDTVILNAAAILYVCGRAKTLKEGVERAARSLDSKSALKVLSQLIEMTHAAG